MKRLKNWSDLIFYHGAFGLGKEKSLCCILITLCFGIWGLKRFLGPLLFRYNLQRSLIWGSCWSFLCWALSSFWFFYLMIILVVRNSDLWFNSMMGFFPVASLGCRNSKLRVTEFCSSFSSYWFWNSVENPKVFYYDSQHSRFPWWCSESQWVSPPSVWDSSIWSDFWVAQWKRNPRQSLSLTVTPSCSWPRCKFCWGGQYLSDRKPLSDPAKFFHAF